MSKQSCCIFIEPLEQRTLLSDVVLDWNSVLLSAIASERWRSGETWASRNAAIVHAAICDAVNGVDRTHIPFFVFKRAPVQADPEAAAAAAAFATLSKLYPGQKSFFRVKYRQTLADIPDGPGERKGVRYGQNVADKILRWRKFDGSQRRAFYDYGYDSGQWQPTPPDFSDARTPAWGDVEMLALYRPDQFIPPPPPELDGREYERAFNQVKELGEENSEFRSAEQTEIALFWNMDEQSLGTSVSMFNEVARIIATGQDNSMSQNARLFAQLNVALADAAISAYYVKYTDHFWRPISAIHDADSDGNLQTIADPFWQPLAEHTPASPAYVSSEAAFAGATFQVLRDFYGTDDMEFTLASVALPQVTRCYSSFSEAAEESALSQVYLGVSFSFCANDGLVMGADVASFISDNYFRSIA